MEAVRNPALSPAEKLAFIRLADEVLGLDLMKEPAPAEALAPELMALVKEREEARKNKDFKRSDELRNLLLEKGVAVEDAPGGTRWKITRK